MHLDVIDLKRFYYRTRLGRVVQRSIRREVAAFWPETRSLTVAGFGFPQPLLRPYLGQARRVMALMPGPQGVMAWPEGQPNHAVLVEETRWPIATGSIDRLVVLHGLETSEQPAALLGEVHRTLGPGGRALFIVPNRSGLWARRDATPFGFGRPYSLGQLEGQMNSAGFEVMKHSAALYAPPSDRRFWQKMAPLWERMGKSISTRVAGGVLLLEVSKHVQAPQRPGLAAAVRRPLGVLEGMATPAGKPVSGFQG